LPPEPPLPPLLLPDVETTWSAGRQRRLAGLSNGATRGGAAFAAVIAASGFINTGARVLVRASDGRHEQQGEQRIVAALHVTSPSERRFCRGKIH